MESNAIIREFSSDVDFSSIPGLGTFFKLTEVFLVDEAATDRLEELYAFSQEQTLNRDLSVNEKPQKEISPDEHLQFGVPCCVQRKTGSSNIGANSENNSSGCSHPYGALQITVSVDSNIQDSSHATCTENISMIHWGAVWDSYYQRKNVSTESAFENGASVNQKQLETMDVNPTNTCFLKGIEIASPENNGQFVEHLDGCFSCEGIADTPCRKKRSASVGALETSMSTIDRLQGCPQECSTHVWFGNDGNIKNKCPFQSISTEVHAQEIENYNEPVVSAFGDASMVAIVSIGDVMDHGEQMKEKRLRPEKKPSPDEDAREPLMKLLLPGMVERLSIGIIKYWCRRYQLFSRFDEGVKLDEEGWFSVTPEILAKHHAERSGKGTIIDCFAGVGGNAIQFAQKSHHVIAIDIDPIKIDYAQHNASVYGVADCIDFIIGDFFQLAPCLKADVVFLSPPWGGPNYTKVQRYDIQTMLKPKDGFSLFQVARMIAPNIIMFLPRNIDLNQLVELSWLSCPPLALEVEKNYINGELKAITAYFGNISIPSIP